MFKVNDEEGSAKSKVLKEIMGMMDKETGTKIGGLKKPAEVSVEVETEAEPEVPEMASEEPTEDEKAMIIDLYEKYCK